MPPTLVAVLSFAAGVVSVWMALAALPRFGAAPPNPRSNHERPTPQIGGLALVPVWLAVVTGMGLAVEPVPVFGEPAVLGAVALLYLLGLADDARALGPLPKLAGQVAGCALATYGMSAVLDAFPAPAWLSHLLCAVLLLAMVNLTNFIDGLDLMAVATVGLPSVGFVLFALGGMIAASHLPVGLATGALFLAFAIFNWPPARTFLGDSGSLPFGLVLGACTVIVAAEAGMLAAALLPGYILFDGGLTLARRAWRGERLMEAHSTHLYQRAYRSGRPALVVSAVAAGFGAICVGLGLAGAASGSVVWQAAAFALACCIWTFIEWRLPRKGP